MKLFICDCVYKGFGGGGLEAKPKVIVFPCQGRFCFCFFLFVFCNGVLRLRAILCGLLGWLMSDPTWLPSVDFDCLTVSPIEKRHVILFDFKIDILLSNANHQ